jgi:hypothetical protein
VEDVMGKAGVAATRLDTRMMMIYGCHEGADGITLEGYHDTMIPLSFKVQTLLLRMRDGSELPSQVRAKDVRNFCLLLPYILTDLLLPEVEEYNKDVAPEHQIVDPSGDLVELVSDYLDWYEYLRQTRLYEDDLAKLDDMARKWIDKCCQVIPADEKEFMGAKMHSMSTCKMHHMLHFTEDIQEFGALWNMSTEACEQAHKEILKRARKTPIRAN